MAAITFASRLQEDGSLFIPKEAVDELGLHPGDEVQVQIETPRQNENPSEPTLLERAVQAMSHRTPEQIAEAQARAMRDYPPVRRVPDGKTLADVISGKWPGNETDAEIEAALRELS